MALERKDIRAKLDPEIHEALTVICEADGVEIGEFVESVIEQIVRKRVHDAQLIAAKVPSFGKFRE
jgi:ATP-dependent Clp protease adapter protein ClpS